MQKFQIYHDLEKDVIDVPEEVVYFYNRFGRLYGNEAHFCLACHAAFPIAMTVDLLFQIWVNFQYADHSDEIIAVPYEAVSDILLSTLFKKVRLDIFEMKKDARDYLLQNLTLHPLFGEKRLKQLAKFVIAYSKNRFTKPHQRTLAQSQRITAYAYLDPELAASEIIDFLNELSTSDNTSELYRFSGLVSTLEIPLKELPELVTYAKALNAKLSGSSDKVNHILSTVGQMKASQANTLDIVGKKLIVDKRLKTAIKQRITKYEVEIGKDKGESIGSQRSEEFDFQDDYEDTAVKPKLKALLVGIGNYPMNKLKGPYYDIRLIKNFLENHYSDERDDLLDIKVLEDEEASRENFIHTFLNYFSDLEDGDNALFYYDGHGSDIVAPNEFRHSHPNKRLGTLVLYDSRQKGGWDLISTELSYLIWEVTKSKDIIFTVINDSCHFGNELKSKGNNFKHQSRVGKMRPWQEYLGAENYIVDNDGNISIPTGRVIQLAACRPYESSSERYLEGFIHGVFTYSLVKNLKRLNGNVNYKELIDWTKILVSQYTRDQHPVLSATYTQDESILFLSRTISKKSIDCILYFRHREDSVENLPVGWITNLGSSNGLNFDLLSSRKLLVYEIDTWQLEQRDSSFAITEVDIIGVFVNHCTIDAPDHLDVDKEYIGVFTNSLSKALKFMFSEDCDRAGLKFLEEQWLLFPSKYLQLTKSIDDALYILNAKDNQLFIKAIETESSFNKLEFQSNTIGKELFSNLEKIARWYQIRGFQNIRSNIRLDSITLELFEVLEVTEDMMSVIQQKQIFDFYNKVPVFYYRSKKDSTSDLSKNKEAKPLFRFRILHDTNSVYERLWVSVIYLDANFSISNQLLSLELLERGQEIWLQFHDPRRNQMSSIIPLYIEESFLTQGITEITKRFKIIISTHESSTNSLNQDGISFNPGAYHTPISYLTSPNLPKKEISNIDASNVEQSTKLETQQTSKLVNSSDWRSFDFAIRVKLID